MNRKQRAERLAQTKLALAKKYENLAKTAGSVPKRKQFLHKAERYRRQAADLSHV